MSIPRTPAVGTDGPAQQWTKAGPVAGPLPAPDLERLQETQEATVAEPAPWPVRPRLTTTQPEERRWLKNAPRRMSW